MVLIILLNMQKKILMVFLAFSCRKRNHRRASAYQNVAKIPRTLKAHEVLRTYNEDNVCKMEFYKLADKTDPFQIQWYAKPATRKFVGTISFH